MIAPPRPQGPAVDDLLADLEARRPGLGALAEGSGQPLDFAAALLPDADEAVVTSAARHLAATLDPTALATPATADVADRAATMAVVLAMAKHARLLDDPQPWRDAVEDTLHDVLARPHAWRDLSAWAVAMTEVADLSERRKAGQLLHLVARAALDATTDTERARARDLLVAMRRKARLARWTAWTRRLGEQLSAPISEALDLVADGDLAMAASDGSPDVLARVVLGEALDGEVTLAVAPSGVVLEWDGDGTPPDAATLGDTPLAPVPTASVAARAWAWDVPPDDDATLTLARGDQRATIALPGAPAA